MKSKTWIDNLKVYEPGRPLEEVAGEFGFEDTASIIKAASNENGLGPSPKAIEAMQRAALGMHRYPDGGTFHLRDKLAGQLNVHPEQILFGNGSNELIVLLAHLFLEPGRQLVMGDRAFAVYFLATELYQAECVRVPMPGYTHDLEAMLEAITPQTRLAAVVNPNNPTGTMVDPQALDRFIECLPEHVVAIIDEAYFEVMPTRMRPDILKHIRAARENLILLRTFSKAHGLAGLRIGYGVGHPVLIARLNKVRQPFNVNAMAQAAAMAALDDIEHLEATRKMVAEGLDYFERELGAMGILTVPSGANFILVQTGHGLKIFESMQKKRVIIRPMNGYGLPEHIRISIGVTEQNCIVINALKRARQA